MPNRFAYKSQKVAQNIELRRNRLYAVLELSKVMRLKLGKPRLVQSLGHSNLALDKEQVQPILEGWKRQLEIGKQEEDNAAVYRIELAQAKAKQDRAETARVMKAIELEHENISSSTYLDTPTPDQVKAAEEAAHAKAEDFAERATGQRVAPADYIDRWMADLLKRAVYSVKTADEAKSIVQTFSGKRELPAFNRHAVQAYVNILTGAGRSADTIKKFSPTSVTSGSTYSAP
jgi:hypothetical protein